MKTCSLCRVTKPLDDFSIQRKGRKDYRHPYCKACNSEKQKARYAEHGKQWFRDNKVCSWCKEAKPRSEFERSVTGRTHARCKACEVEIIEQESAGRRFCNICRKWLAPGAFHPSKLKQTYLACAPCTRAQMAQPDYKARRREFMLAKEYGITGTQYDALVAKQGGNCPICLEPLPANRGGHVDHAHGGKHAGRIRAILHNDCNRFVMWTHEDSAQLRRAADLIDNPLTDWIVAEPTLNERRREKERQK
jgi:hypothetical protein